MPRPKTQGSGARKGARACAAAMLLAAAVHWAPTAAQAPGEAPPAISSLFSDSIVYFHLPAGAELEITFAAHRYQFENPAFDIFDEQGEHFHRVVFRCQSPELCAEAVGSTRTVELAEAGTYKLVAYGPRFIYDLRFTGPTADWGLVVLGTPHKPPLRLAKHTGSIELYFRVFGSFTFFAGGEWSEAPVRQHSITLYDPAGVQRASLSVPSDVAPDAFESSVAIDAGQSGAGFWRARIRDVSSGTTPSAVGIWTNQGQFVHPLGPAILLTPAPEYYFVPRFRARDVQVRLGAATGRRLEPGTAGLPNRVVDPTDPLYEPALERLRDLRMTTLKHYVGWYWREGSPRERRNDDADPEHIDWDGFNFGPFDARMAYLTEAGLKPLLCLDWASPYEDAIVDFVGSPDSWGPTEMSEYAEFVEAVVTYAVAPDLVDPALAREPYEILGIQLMGEPNLTMRGSLDPRSEWHLIL